MECRLVLNNCSESDIPKSDLCGHLQQQLKYYKFRRVPTKSGRAVFYLFFRKEEETYYALRAAKSIKDISLVRYRHRNITNAPTRLDDISPTEMHYRPVPPQNIVNAIRYNFTGHISRFCNKDMFKLFVRRLSDQVVAHRLQISDVLDRIHKVLHWWWMNHEYTINNIQHIKLSTINSISNTKNSRLHMSEAVNKIVQLNQDVGYYLLNFLEGIDASNFLQVVNTTNQFRGIAPTSNHEFFTLMKIFSGRQRILVPEGMYKHYLDECKVVDYKLVPFKDNDSCFIRPVQRLFVHPCFTIESFNRLCQTYRTSLFQCYCRLLPFNTDLYCSDFGLLDYELYNQTITSGRNLNDYEKKFFKANTYFQIQNHQSYQSSITFVRTVDEFRKNLATRFSSSLWLDAIDFSKFILVGSCVIDALCQSPLSNPKENDINLIHPSISDGFDFMRAVTDAIVKLQTITSKYSKQEITIEQTPGTLRVDVFLPCGMRLNFSDVSTLENCKNPLSHILHNFDMDICQVAFTGNRIISTFAFLQALATKSFIVYSLHAETTKNVCVRIAKYCQRGFTFLEPINFDGNFRLLMEQAEIPLYRVEHRDYIDDDGEIQTETKEYRRRPARNIDTFQLQEAFMITVCPQLLEDK